MQFAQSDVYDTQIWNYLEQYIQFGYIAMFTQSFPLAPLCSFITNLLELKIKENNFFYYCRRGPCNGASKIGAALQ